MNQVVKQESKEPAVVTLLRQSEAQIAKALPKHLTPDRIARIALTEIRKTPKLLQCDPYSVLGAIMQASQLGLEIGSGLGHAYLVPYKTECTLITGYKGQVDLMRRSGRIKGVWAHIIYPEDVFEEGIRDGKPFVTYNAARTGQPRDAAKEMLFAFAIAAMDDGTTQWVVMEKWEVDRIRDGLRYKSDTWADHYGEMAKKTAVRRLSKMLPMSPELVQANALEDGDARSHQPFIDMKLLADSYETKAQVIGEMAEAQPDEHKLSHDRKADDDAKGAALKEFDKAAAAFKDVGGNVWETIKRDPAKANEWDIAIIKAATDILNSKMRSGK